MVNIFKSKLLWIFCGLLLLAGCNVLPQKSENQEATRIHSQNCVGKLLVECVRMLADDFANQEEFIDAWRESYVRMPHAGAHFKSLYPYLDNDSKADPKLAVNFFYAPSLDFCFGYQCDRTMALYFFDKEKISTAEFTRYFGMLTVDKISRDAQPNDPDSYSYQILGQKKCVHFVLGAKNGVIESIGMYRYPLETCKKIRLEN